MNSITSLAGNDIDLEEASRIDSGFIAIAFGLSAQFGSRNEPFFVLCNDKAGRGKHRTLHFLPAIGFVEGKNNRTKALMRQLRLEMEKKTLLRMVPSQRETC